MKTAARCWRCLCAALCLTGCAPSTRLVTVTEYVPMCPPASVIPRVPAVAGPAGPTVGHALAAARENLAELELLREEVMGLEQWRAEACGER